MPRYAIAADQGFADTRLVWWIERTDGGDLHVLQLAGRHRTPPTNPRVVWRADGSFRGVDAAGVLTRVHREPPMRVARCQLLLRAPLADFFDPQLPHCDPLAFDEVLELPRTLADAEAWPRFELTLHLCAAGASPADDDDRSEELLRLAPGTPPCLVVSLDAVEPELA